MSLYCVHAVVADGPLPLLAPDRVQCSTLRRLYICLCVCVCACVWIFFLSQAECHWLDLATLLGSCLFCRCRRGRKTRSDSVTSGTFKRITFLLCGRQFSLPTSAGERHLSVMSKLSSSESPAVQRYYSTTVVQLLINSYSFQE